MGEEEAGGRVGGFDGEKEAEDVGGFAPVAVASGGPSGACRVVEVASAAKVREGDGGFPCSACFVVDDGKSLSVVFDAHPSRSAGGFAVDPDFDFFHLVITELSVEGVGENFLEEVLDGGCEDECFLGDGEAIVVVGDVVVSGMVDAFGAATERVGAEEQVLAVIKGDDLGFHEKKKFMR